MFWVWCVEFMLYDVCCWFVWWIRFISICAINDITVVIVEYCSLYLSFQTFFDALGLLSLSLFLLQIHLQFLYLPFRGAISCCFTLPFCLQNAFLAAVTTTFFWDDRWPTGLKVRFAHQKCRIAVQHVAGTHRHDAGSDGTCHVYSRSPKTCIDMPWFVVVVVSPGGKRTYKWLVSSVCAWSFTLVWTMCEKVCVMQADCNFV